MADDVFVIDVDLDKLEEALKISEKIKSNLGHLTMTGEELINNATGKGKNGKQTTKKEKEATGDKVNKELEKGNKLWNARDKILGMINKKLNLMRLVESGLAKKGFGRLSYGAGKLAGGLELAGGMVPKIGSGLGKIGGGALGLMGGGLALTGGAMLGAAAGGIGLAGAGIVSGINSMKGSNAIGMQAKNVGLDSKQSQAMSYTGKMMGLGEGTLMQSIQGLTTSLQDFDKWGSFASLSLSPTKLQGENPMDALFEVLDAMKKSDLPQVMKKQILDDIGVPFDQFKFVLKEGTGDLRKYFKEGKNIFSDTDSGALQMGEKAMIKFNTVLSSISQEIGKIIAPTLTKALNGLIPIVQKVGDVFNGLLDTLLNSDIAKTIGDTVKNMFSSGKELFSSMFAGFSIDTEGWKETIGGFLGSFGEEFSQMFDSLKPMFQNLGQKITEIWNVLEPDLMNFIDWFKEKIMPTMMSIGGKVLNFLGNTLTNVIDDFLWFYQKVKPVMEGIGNVMSSLYKKFNEFLEGIGFGADDDRESLSELFANLNSPISLIRTITEALPDMTKWIDKIGGIIDKIDKFIQGFDIDFITKSFKEIFYAIDKGIDDFMKGLMNFGIGEFTIGGALKRLGAGEYLPKYFEKNGWQMVRDRRTGIETYAGEYGEPVQYPTMRAINDGIITSRGEIVKTNPKDYIIATTNPAELVSGGGNITYSITINNPVVRDDRDIQKLKNDLKRMIDMFNSKAR